MNKVFRFNPPQDAYTSWGICLVIVMLFSACQKPPSTSSDLNYQYLDSKFKLSFQGLKENFNAKVRIRMRRDSLIWASITGPVGVEGIRTQLSQDSLYLIDRVNKKYSENTLDTLSQFLKFPVDYPLLQALLLGDMPLPGKNILKEDLEDKLIRIEQEYSGIYLVNFLNPKTRKLAKLDLRDLKNGNTLHLNFENYKKVKGNWFPFSSSVLVNYRDPKTKLMEETKLKIEYSKLEVGKEVLSFPFNVPDKYRE